MLKVKSGSSLLSFYAFTLNLDHEFLECGTKTIEQFFPAVLFADHRLFCEIEREVWTFCFFFSFLFYFFSLLNSAGPRCSVSGKPVFATDKATTNLSINEQDRTQAYTRALKIVDAYANTCICVWALREAVITVRQNWGLMVPSLRGKLCGLYQKQFHISGAWGRF